MQLLGTRVQGADLSFDEARQGDRADSARPDGGARRLLHDVTGLNAMKR